MSYTFKFHSSPARTLWSGTPKILYVFYVYVYTYIDMKSTFTKNLQDH